jgi:hypothetical protein
MKRINTADRTADVSKPDPLVFEVVFSDPVNREAGDTCLEGRSVVVEVESAGLREALAITADPVDAARREAEALACRAALQTVQKDLPEGVEPACSSSQLDHLPDELQGTAPTLRTDPASAWLV